MLALFYFEVISFTTPNSCCGTPRFSKQIRNRKYSPSNLTKICFVHFFKKQLCIKIHPTDNVYRHFVKYLEKRSDLSRAVDVRSRPLGGSNGPQ